MHSGHQKYPSDKAASFALVKHKKEKKPNLFWFSDSFKPIYLYSIKL